MRRSITNPISPEKGKFLYASIFGPVGKTLVFAAVLYKDAALAVLHLFRSRSPFAVTWFVIATAILSFNGMAWRSAAHIRKKVFKRRLPTLANTNSKRAIEFERFMFWVSASLPHRRPRPPLRCVSSSVNNSMREFTRKAPTGLCTAGQKVVHSNCRYLAAITLAEPKRSSFRAVRKPHSDQSTESLTSQISTLHSLIISPTLIRRCLGL